MVVPPTKLELEAKLARSRELVREFPDGPIPQMLRDLEDDLREQNPKVGKTVRPPCGLFIIGVPDLQRHKCSVSGTD
jgi:hypothetical protein